MDDLTRIRQQKHKDYLKESWLPQITEKYRKLSDPKTKATKTIIRFARNNYLYPVVNDDMLDLIPGIFRCRVKLTLNHLFKPETISFDDINDNDNHLNVDLQDILKESLKEYEDEIQQNILNQSLIGDIEENGFYICIDLRDYGPNPNQPIYYDDVVYYLSNKQIKRINKLWNKVNPDTTCGIKLSQDLAYYKSVSYDFS